MDNARYHKALPFDAPRKSMKKIDLQNACVQYGLAFPLQETKHMLSEKVSKYMDKHIAPVVVSMAEERCHTVLFTPLHHSNLQPVELVWANVKGAVGRQYQHGITSFTDVFRRLRTAFDSLSPSEIHGCIGKANKELLNLHNYLQALDAADDNATQSTRQEDDSFECDSSDNCSDSGSDSA
ncbi:hypothetical protein AC1031_015697, partial [Aphanomyces cochlioides]